MTEVTNNVILEARKITRRYPGSLALDGVDFVAYRGQVNVLIGENGAGKSTLMRILSGVEVPDEGRILLEGVEVSLHSPRDASAHGIMIVHQELSVIPNLNISENVFAGRELTRNTLIHEAEQDSRSATSLRRLHLDTGVRTSAGDLSLGARQLVELARTLTHHAGVLILDEPTSALSAAETEELFSVIADLKSAGVTIIYISHRLHELLHLGDHFTVLRSGKVVGAAPRSEVTREWIVERMTGRVGRLDQHRSYVAESGTTPALEIHNLSLAASTLGSQPQSAVNEVSFQLNRGEILGIYGLLGSGRTEVMEAVAGLRDRLAGEVVVDGVALRIDDVQDAIAAGIVLVPEDRQRDGLVPELSIRENVLLALSAGPFLSKTQETQTVQELVRKLNIAARDLELPVSALSGGNQQKVLIARCLARSPVILLLDEPTRGVDVGAKAEIYQNLCSLADRGLSILFTSSEVEEMQLLADRALVLCQGSIAAELAADEITDSALFALASPKVGQAGGRFQSGSVA